MKFKKPEFFFALCIVTGWIGEQFFWGQQLGINFPLFTLLVIGIGLFLTRKVEQKPAKLNLWTLIPILFFATMIFLRREPLTTFLNFCATILFLALFAHGFLGEHWWGYGFMKFISKGLGFISKIISYPLTALAQKPEEETIKNESWHKVRPYLKGLLFALPLVLFFTGLLSSADPIFQERAKKVFGWLVIEDFATLFVQIWFILILSWGLAGAYLIAMNKDGKKSSDEEKALKNKLGFIESSMMLGSVNLLFLSFVAIQFRYFFGGTSNINLASYTYAEYARRGFGELVAVAAFSLLFFLGLGAISAREGQKQLWSFSGQGILLVSLVSIILVSAMQRLNLYETVYGFTRLRTYTHIFIIWLGIYLAAVVILEVLRWQKFSMPALLVAAMGFIITLNLLNVDGFIVNKNVEHLDTITFNTPDSNRSSSDTLDIVYLSSLSSDALPSLARNFNSADENTKGSLAGALFCHALLQDDYQLRRDEDWRSFNLSQWAARSTWEKLLTDNLSTYEEMVVAENNSVIIAGTETSCYTMYWE